MTYLLTKTDIQAIRGAEDLVVHLNNKDNGLVRLAKRADHGVPFSEDKTWPLTVDVSIHGYKNRDLVTNGGVKCFAMVSFYHSQGTHASSIMKQLRVGDEIELEFYPDYGNNGYVDQTNLHADALLLHVKRKGTNGIKRQTFELDQSICPDNSARMCRGVPAKEVRDTDLVRDVRLVG